MADKSNENIGTCDGEELTLSDKLHSHTFEAHPRWPNFDLQTHKYRCTVCGFEAFGSGKGPTIYKTTIERGIDILSCNESVVKDILV